ncbi:SAM-dependent methyltransferase [Rhodovulum sp. YNF3179]|uniref:SAM-dependent methyltransferase n=1 Tax=Rhodovulum sp. YNF3179 TaxID=3425127 RepID=UPI003D3417A7
MWNDRYDRPDYLFGTAPAVFLTEQAEWLRPGLRALAVADGEGRNSVYMAGQGLDVVAFDAAEVGLDKARRLAAARGVTVDFRLSDIESWDWDAAPYDLVVAIFIQFADPALRARIFEGMTRALAPGGVLLLHGYRPEQVDYGTGGPPLRENMYTEEMLRVAFADLEILRLESYDREVQEGEGHSGMSALIDLVARKPAS